MSRLARIAMRAYPPSFRARYGEELAALVEDLPASRRATVDLFAGAGRAWIRPTFAGDGPYRLGCRRVRRQPGSLGAQDLLSFRP